MRKEKEAKSNLTSTQEADGGSSNSRGARRATNAMAIETERGMVSKTANDLKKREMYQRMGEREERRDIADEVFETKKPT